MKKEPDTRTLEIYMAAKILSGRIWHIVEKWGHYERENFGDALVSASDSLSIFVSKATIYGEKRELLNYARLARAQFFETRHWLKKAYKQEIISDEETDELLKLMEKLGPEIKMLVEKLGGSPGVA